MSLLNNNPSLQKGLLVYVITFSLSLLVGIYMILTGKDFMDTSIFNCEMLYNITGEFNCVSWWNISHFIMYVILGFLSPEYWLLWFGCGVGWELFESLCGKIMSKTGIKIHRVDTETQYGDMWVSGSFTDIIFNSAGLLIGVLLSKVGNKNRNKNKKNKSKMAYINTATIKYYD